MLCRVLSRAHLRKYIRSVLSALTRKLIWPATDCAQGVESKTLEVMGEQLLHQGGCPRVVRAPECVEQLRLRGRGDACKLFWNWWWREQPLKLYALVECSLNVTAWRLISDAATTRRPLCSTGRGDTYLCLVRLHPGEHQTTLTATEFDVCKGAQG